ncbi:hypothetical protein KAS08_02330 [Candidatus Pacearchaeota archaeon]|nr:hypothetical protein [Candidatus Pacearchaeota archaeon]
MNKIFLLLAVALALPLATAFNCNDLIAGEIEICNSIKDSSLSIIEKNLLIADIFNPTNVFPDHDFVYSWNLDLNIEESPNGITTNRGVIKDAWIKIIAPMPSVLEEGILYIPERGKILSEYNYDIELPTHRQRYDCRTRYSLRDQDETLRIFINGNYIGNNKLMSFVISGSNNDNIILKSQVEIKVKYRIKHYRRRNGWCRYSYSEYVTDRITISDTLNTKLLKANPESLFEITNEYNGMTAGYLEANNISALELSFIDAEYRRTNYIYKLNYTLPYYVLTLEAIREENTELNNIHVDENQDRFEFVIKDIANCRIKLFSHFGNILRNCDLSYNEIDFEIKTDKLNYYIDETISVTILPENLELNITYAGESIIAKNFAEFKAVENQNKITAQLNTRKTKRFINVFDEDDKELLIEFSSIGFFGYIIFSFLSKYYFSLRLL